LRLVHLEFGILGLINTIMATKKSARPARKKAPAKKTAKKSAVKKKAVKKKAAPKKKKKPLKIAGIKPVIPSTK
jgi:hypothetical protein